MKTILIVCACAMMLVGCAGGDGSFPPPMKDLKPQHPTTDANVPDVGVIPPQDCPDCVQDAALDTATDTNAMNWNYDCLVPGQGAIKCKTEDGGTSFTWSDTADNNASHTCEACPLGVECLASDGDGGMLVGHCGAN